MAERDVVARSPGARGRAQRTGEPAQEGGHGRGVSRCVAARDLGCRPGRDSATFAAVSTAGLIGVSLLGLGVVATTIFGVLRCVLVSWCPGCNGRGFHALEHRIGIVCDVCHGRGQLHVPDAPPADWFRS